MSEACLGIRRPGPTYFYNGKCYAIIQKDYTWTEAYRECTSEASSFQPIMDYGRGASFSTTADLATVTKSLYALSQGTPVPNGVPETATVNGLLWVGAMASSFGSSLSDYCWMNTEDTAGAQVSPFADPVNISLSSGNAPLGLAVDVANPTVLYGMDFDDHLTASYNMICEFGRRARLSSIRI